MLAVAHICLAGPHKEENTLTEEERRQNLLTLLHALKHAYQTIREEHEPETT